MAQSSIEARLAAMEEAAEMNRIATDATWQLVTATIVFLMQYGFALLECGMCRKNNTTATYTKNMLDATFGTAIALLWGYRVAYGRSPFVCASSNWGPHDYETSTQVCSSFFHYLVFQATAATVMSGAMAERTTIGAYAVLSCFVSAVPFSLVVNWTWGGGWLSRLGFHDFAGGAIVHVVGGAAATAGVAVVGPRDGRYDPRRFYEFLPQDVSSVMSGALVVSDALLLQPALPLFEPALA